MKFLLAAAGLVGIGVVIALAVSSSRPAPPHVLVTPHALDLGTIRQEEGVVTRTVLVKNEGGQPLDLYRLSTSCGCTTAKMELTPLAPGEERSMTVTYDPNVHADETGTIERVVYLQTSDPKTPEVSIDVTGEVLPDSNL